MIQSEIKATMMHEICDHAGYQTVPPKGHDCRYTTQADKMMNVVEPER